MSSNGLSENCCKEPNENLIGHMLGRQNGGFTDTNKKKKKIYKKNMKNDTNNVRHSMKNVKPCMNNVRPCMNNVREGKKNVRQGKNCKKT